MIITNYAIKFRIAVFVFIAALVALGTIAYKTIPREGFPDITIPQVFIYAPYPGTAPQDMENLVTIPIEKKLNDLGSVKEITSTSAESIISRNELVECLTQGGYQVIEQWGEYDRRPYCADSKRIIVLAERGDKEEQDKGQPAGAGVLPEARIRAHR